MGAWLLAASGLVVVGIGVEVLTDEAPELLRHGGLDLDADEVRKWLGQAVIAYAWLVVALSLFDATRNYTQRLTGFVVLPASQLMERLASALPLLIVAVIASLAVFVHRPVKPGSQEMGVIGMYLLSWYAVEIYRPDQAGALPKTHTGPTRLLDADMERMMSDYAQEFSFSM